jgi:hypothetical protein
MALSRKTKIILIVGSILVVAGGIGAYFLLRQPRGEEGDGEGDKEIEDEVASSSDSGVSSSVPKYTAPAELNSIDKIKAFQDWMDAQGKGWILKNGKWLLLNKGAGYGNYGKNTDAVWKVYGSEYLKAPKKFPVLSSNAPSESDISVINQKAIGDRADKTMLRTLYAPFVKEWARVLRDTPTRTTFYWNGKTYRLKTGTELLNYIPVGKTFYASKTGLSSKETASSTASAGQITKGETIGVAGASTFDGKYLYIYFPDRLGNKWVYESALTTTKPSSSFTGGNMDSDMFASFDNNLDLNL